MSLKKQSCFYSDCLLYLSSFVFQLRDCFVRLVHALFFFPSPLWGEGTSFCNSITDCLLYLSFSVFNCQTGSLSPIYPLFFLLYSSFGFLRMTVLGFSLLVATLLQVHFWWLNYYIISFNKMLYNILKIMYK